MRRRSSRHLSRSEREPFPSAAGRVRGYDASGETPDLPTRKKERAGPFLSLWERCFWLTLLAFSSPAPAADVPSARPEAVAVTVYRDQPMSTAQLRQLGEDDTHGLALIVETRTVDLPAGRSRLRFEGVADGIIPQSASVEGLPARIVERNFDYDLLTPGSLIAHAVGETVEIVRTERKTGRTSEETAVLRSGPDGVVLDVGGKIEALKCGGEAERLVFDHAPAGLTDRPTLSLAVDAPTAGRYQVRLSYLTVRMDWSADYIARVNLDGKTLALTGWITLTNRSALSFVDAPTEVVAGHLSRAPLDLPRIAVKQVTPGCWPGQTTHSGWVFQDVANNFASLAGAAAYDMAMPPPPMMMRPEMVTSARKERAIESQLGDYKLYTLAEPTTVAARQTKQVMFLDQPAVKFETVYLHRSGLVADSGPQSAQTVLRFMNKSDNGLGRALPTGSLSVRRSRNVGGGSDLFVGEYPIERDVPVGEPFEIVTGNASDVTVRDRAENHTTARTAKGVRDTTMIEVVATNAKSTPVVVEIRHDRQGADGFEIRDESQPHGFKAGDPLWRLAVPANDRTTLRYTVEVRQ